MSQIYNSSLHSTARILLFREKYNSKEKYYILSDDEKELINWEKISAFIIGKQAIRIHTHTDLFLANQKTTGIYLVHTHIFEGTHTLDYIFGRNSFFIERWNSIAPEIIVEKLVELWYIFKDFPEQSGEYKREGDVIRVMDHWNEYEYIIEYFDSEIDDIISIEKSTGMREHKQNISLIRKNITIDENQKSILNKEILQTLIESKNNYWYIGWDFLPYNETLINTFPQENTSLFPGLPSDEWIRCTYLYPSIDTIESLKTLVETYASNTTIYTKYPRSFHEFLEYNGISSCQVKETSTQQLESYLDEKNKKLILCDDILGKIFVRKRTKKSLAKNLDLLLHIQSWDYVVHRDHGIGRFEQIISKELAGIKREYMELLYLDGDKIFVPLTELYRLSKYVGENSPLLTNLKWKEWERLMKKTDEEIEKIAEEILETGAKRAIAKWTSFPAFHEQENTFLHAFKYIHTPDQIEAIWEIFADMESDQAMDRLLSGDVWFWKTEVAMNAIYKAVLAGAQVAVISPLLVLSDEHAETFSERMGWFGVRIASLTRMTSKSEEKEILRDLKNGKIDVIVWTHRLLSEDIIFHQLWLLVIDEEHKFGVSHKERFKQFKAHIDILSLSATPIPRSLNLALSGIKKTSLLTTPPRNKKPIRTLVSRWEDFTIEKAIKTEMERGGQVIILHNRIASLDTIEKEIKNILHDASIKIITTHGRMNGDEIEERIHDFKKGKYHILLTTTIIENGVNFLSANTIIISNAEEFWLAQLHQLRWRVWRKDVEWICYLLYRKYELVGEEKERIITLVNNTHLGAWFEIAMRDMEIRGAGDILWIRQSGKSKDVGLSLYFQLLEEKISEIKNQKNYTLPPCKIELDLSYSIESTYFENEIDKITFFRDIESIETIEDIYGVEQSFIDANGTISEEGENFFLLIKSRLILQKYGIISLKKVGANYIFDFHEKNPIEKLKEFLEKFDKSKNYTLLSTYKIRVATKHWKNTKGFLWGFL